MIKSDLGKHEAKNWVIAEEYFKEEYLAKFETIFSLGNGYMSLRATTEEYYQGKTKGFYIAGLFDRFPAEVTELPNLPDWSDIEITLAGEKFSLNRGNVLSYNRSLDLKIGLLTRKVVWESPNGLKSRLKFKRFLSLANYHLAGLEIKITPLNYSGEIKIKSGFDGRITNSGTQHLIEGDKRVFKSGSMYYTGKTQQSGIFVAIAADQCHVINERKVNIEPEIEADRRELFQSTRVRVGINCQYKFNKLIMVYTSRDNEFMAKRGVITGEQVLNKTLSELKQSAKRGYQKLFAHHRHAWARLWQEMDCTIDGDDFAQLAVRFAQFHLIQMTPTHDARISVAAKGLSGEGYKGHVFWDTEIFILPFFLYTFPDIAKSLLMYRYHTLNGARKKAGHNGYQGAMYAWESATTGEETTPSLVGVDVKTGQPIRIWCGEIEQHITADVAYAIWQYFEMTGDYSFMYNYGSEVFLEATRFWASRLEYNPDKNRFEINDVIGPDEYSEHVNNNAYTNYLVKWQLIRALELSEILQKEAPASWERLKQKIKLTDDELTGWDEIKGRIYTPFDGNTMLIPQFDGFMKKKSIDLSKYKGRVGEILKKLGWEEINKSQVLKQADVVMLLYLLSGEFPEEVKKRNFDYYEPITLHDSSLSPSIHSIVAAEMNEPDKAYRYFEQACRIDLSNNMVSSNDGLHAASLGGIWLTVVQGFAGIRLKGGKLSIKPKLPKKWKMLKLFFCWHKHKYHIEMDQNKTVICPVGGSDKETKTIDSSLEFILD